VRRFEIDIDIMPPPGRRGAPRTEGLCVGINPEVRFFDLEDGQFFQIVNASSGVLTFHATLTNGHEFTESLQSGARTRRVDPAHVQKFRGNPRRIHIPLEILYSGEIIVEGEERCDPKVPASKTVEISVYEHGVAPQTVVAEVGDYIVWVNRSSTSCGIDCESDSLSPQDQILPGHRSAPIQLLSNSEIAGYTTGFPFTITFFPDRGHPALSSSVIVKNKVFRSPAVNEACRQLRDVNKELKEIPSGWFGVGRKHDVPHNACYVGHYGKCYTWVCPENVESLTAFSLSIAKLSTVIKGRQVIASPGVQYSPGFSFAPR
jgi:hypothetical protein